MTITTACVMIAACALWLALAHERPVPRARAYLAFKACLLTGAKGITDSQAASAWAGMEKASLKTRARVQYLPAFGPATVANAQPYLNSLIQQRCNVIAAIGDTPVAAVQATAGRNPRTQFIVIGATVSIRNVTSVPATADAVSAAIIQRVRAA